MSGAVVTGLLGAALLLAAGMLDAEPLYPPALGFLALALLAATWVALAARGAGIRRSPLPRRATEGEPVDVVLDVRRGALPPPGGRVRDPLFADGLPLPRGGAGPVRIRVRFARRGRRVLAPPALVLRDPLGLAQVDVPAPGGADEVLVLPRIEPVRGPDGGAGEGTSRRALAAAPAATEIDGLRPYREGAPATRIHWPAVARGLELVERRLSSQEDGRPLVVLDARAPASDDALDAAVRAAASLAHALARESGCALLLPGDRRPLALEGLAGGWAAAHARLALVTGGTAPVLAGGAPRRGVVVYVAARPVRALPPALAALARGPQVVVAPEDPPAPGALFTVAGCAGRALGDGARRRAAA